MTLVKKDGNVLNPLPVFFDDFFNRDFFNWGLSNFPLAETTIPAANMKETANEYIVELAVPGMEKKDFKIEMEGNILSVSSEKKTEYETKKEEQYTRKEFSYQSFLRRFNLEKDVVDADKIVAKYENGVLQLLIPKKEEAKHKAPKMIKIS